MQCKKCNKNFSSSVTIEGKRRNLKNRKYCLECSPFDRHNTKRLEYSHNENIIRKCRFCEKEIIRNGNGKGNYCWTCTNRKSRQKKISRIQSLTGNACWICGYDKCWQALDFHHVNPEDKLFCLTIRELQYSWEKIELEIKKCVLLCCRCHREVHSGIIHHEQIRALWLNKWNLNGS